MQATADRVCDIAHCVLAALKNGNANRDLTIQAKDREIATGTAKVRDIQTELDANTRAMVDMERLLEQHKDQLTKVKAKVSGYHMPLCTGTNSARSRSALGASSASSHKWADPTTCLSMALFISL